MYDIHNFTLKGCKEIDVKKIFTCCTNDIEFNMKFYASRIMEIKEEIQELNDEDMDAEEDEIGALKNVEDHKIEKI